MPSENAPTVVEPSLSVPSAERHTTGNITFVLDPRILEDDPRNTAAEQRPASDGEDTQRSDEIPPAREASPGAEPDPIREKPRGFIQAGIEDLIRDE